VPCPYTYAQLYSAIANDTPRYGGSGNRMITPSALKVVSLSARIDSLLPQQLFYDLLIIS
jgi:hypothetical protein